MVFWKSGFTSQLNWSAKREIKKMPVKLTKGNLNFRNFLINFVRTIGLVINFEFILIFFVKQFYLYDKKVKTKI